MKIKAKTGDLALGIFSILGGIIILILTKVQGLQLIKSGQMGPGFFPTIRSEERRVGKECRL